MNHHVESLQFTNRITKFGKYNGAHIQPDGKSTLSLNYNTIYWGFYNLNEFTEVQCHLKTLGGTESNFSYNYIRTTLCNLKF